MRVTSNGAAHAAEAGRLRRLRGSARATLGDAVVDHYTNMADVELKASHATVTDWGNRRGFERL